MVLLGLVADLISCDIEGQSGNNSFLQGQSFLEEICHSINWLELCTIHLALLSFSAQLHQAHVLVCMDNMTAKVCQQARMDLVKEPDAGGCFPLSVGRDPLGLDQNRTSIQDSKPGSRLVQLAE